MIEPTDSPAGTRTAGPIAWFSLLVLRGLLLWIVAPLAFVAWLCLTPWIRARRISAGQFLGWVDNNLVAGLERTVLRPLFRDPPQTWIHGRDIEQVRHRIGTLSFF